MSIFLANIENEYTSRRGEDCMKMVCTSLKEHAANVIDNITFNKRRTKITSRCKSMLHFWKKIPKRVF